MGKGEPLIAIDFGTSYSKMAWYNAQKQQPEILRNLEGEEKIPSVVYMDKDNSVLVGKSALQMLEEDDRRAYVIANIKRDLSAGVVLTIGKRYVKPVDVVREVLARLKHDAEKGLTHATIRRVVLTHPVAMPELEKKILADALHQAGFVEWEMIPEPIAAALAYAEMHAQQAKSILTYDMGGGTLDLAHLERDEEGEYHVISHWGTSDCAGNDFDSALYEYLDQQALEIYQTSITKDQEQFDLSFKEQCRELKEKLTTLSSARLKYAKENRLLIFSVTRQNFDELIQRKVEATLQTTLDILRKARQDGRPVEMLVLIGGSTRIPLIQRLLRERVKVEHPSLQVYEWHQSDLAVALGAAYFAYTLWNPARLYERSARNLLHKKDLGEQDILELQTTAQKLELPADQVLAVEYKIVQRSKEEHYYALLLTRIWQDRFWEPQIRQALLKVSSRFNLSPGQIARIEKEQIGQTKEEAIYSEWVRQAYAHRHLEQSQVEDLRVRACELGLQDEQVVAIEHTILGDSKDHLLLSYSQLIVAADGSGAYRSIKSALEAATVGMKILVRPGTYHEELVLDKPLEIIGDGPSATILVKSVQTSCIQMKTNRATVKGLTLVCQASGNHPAVFLSQGELLLEDCEITSSSSGSLISIQTSLANPTIRNCRLHGGKTNGILVSDCGRGTIEKCEIVGMGGPGVEIAGGGNPTLRDCHIHDGLRGGVYAHGEGSLGSFLSCQIYRHPKTGVEIKDGANLTLLDCQIYGNKFEAIWVRGYSQATVRRCDLTGNKKAWDIRPGSSVNRSDNKV